MTLKKDVLCLLKFRYYSKRVGELSHIFSGDVPLDPALMSSSDSGRPIVISNPDSVVSKIYSDIAKKISSKFVVIQS